MSGGADRCSCRRIIEKPVLAQVRNAIMGRMPSDPSAGPPTTREGSCSGASRARGSLKAVLVALVRHLTHLREPSAVQEVTP
jgi:hypothetical protein